MKILPVNYTYVPYSCKRNKLKTNEIKQESSRFNYNTFRAVDYNPVSFGYCMCHMRLMKTLNEKFSNTISTMFANYEQAKLEEEKFNKKLNEGKNVYKLGSQMLAQYANYQYSMAEVIPSYAIESSSEIMNAFAKTSIFSNPVDILLTLKHIPDLKTQTSIDKNTGSPYTKEQMKKSKASTQLYTAVILIENLDRNLEASSLSEKVKSKIIDIRNNVLSSISNIYGNNAFDKIQFLKQMGENASVENKRKSLQLLREFDSIAQELNWNQDFYSKLTQLVDYINASENRHEHSSLDINLAIPSVVMKYHTHPEGHQHAHSHHVNEHSHEYMHEHNIEHNHES